MKTTFVVLTLAALVSIALAEIYCSKDICSKIMCPIGAREDYCLAQPNRRWDPKGGICHCCPACIKVHQLGESCLDTMMLGPWKKAECAEGLRCDLATKKCVPMGTVPSLV